MLNKIFLFLVISILPFWIKGWAQPEEHAHVQDAVTHPATNKAENAGNKICPVMGNKIEEATKVTYEYKGKVYNFCCSGCIDEFKKDPAKYIKIIEEEKNNSQPVAVK